MEEEISKTIPIDISESEDESDAEPGLDDKEDEVPVEIIEHSTTPEKPPHNYQVILKDADDDFHLDESSLESMYDELYKGVFLKQKRQMYRVDKETGSNGFRLYAKELSIAWGDNDTYWRWSREPEKRGVSVEVAKLEDVCWLEIQAKFDSKKLTPGTLYQVSFIIKKDQNVNGWDEEVTLKLNCPDGTTQQLRRSFNEIKKKDKWIRVRVGEFLLSAQDTKELEVFLLETTGGKWKTGLYVKGVMIKPKEKLAHA